MSGAYYLALREDLKVARTEVRQEWPLVAVDYSAEGTAIGIEAVGFEGLDLGLVFETAQLKPDADLLQNTVIETRSAVPA